ncbi:MAG: hypothetical protein GY947_16075 [Rhodobacteraceae bacterium]|nr:hypothetical protein [Paracoccaceae bacterium]
MTEPDKNTEAELRAFFEAAKLAEPEPDDDLMNRIMHDAALVQVQHQRSDNKPGASIGFWAAVSDSLGGWRGMTALAACTCVGLWIGFATPEVVNNYSGGLITSGQGETLDFADLYGFEDMLTES